MSVAHGFGLTGLFPSDTSIENQMNFLKEFARLELTNKFIEIIKDKSRENQNSPTILEIICGSEPKLLKNNDSSFKTILPLWETGSGSMSSNYASNLLQCIDIFIPNFEKSGIQTIELSSLERELNVAGFNYIIEALQEMREDLDDDKKEFSDHIINIFKTGQENSFLFTISD